jgi:hypothetical protein
VDPVDAVGAAELATGLPPQPAGHVEDPEAATAVDLGGHDLVDAPGPKLGR